MNYIEGKTETYNEDMKVLLTMYKVHNISEVMNGAYQQRRSNEKVNATSVIYMDSWSSVSSVTIENIRQIYNEDFKMFNYPTSPY